MSFVNTLSAFLANILSPLTGNSDFTVTDSAHFSSTISGEKIQDHKIMVSFDKKSFFTDVPTKGAVEAALRKLESDTSLADRTTLTAAQIADLIDPHTSSIMVRSTNS